MSGREREEGRQTERYGREGGMEGGGAGRPLIRHLGRYTRGAASEAPNQQITLTVQNTNIRAGRAALLRRTVLIITFYVSYRIVRGWRGCP